MKTEFMAVSKRKTPRCELRIGDGRIKSVYKFSYLGIAITDDTEIRRRNRLRKDAFY